MGLLSVDSGSRLLGLMVLGFCGFSASRLLGLSDSDSWILGMILRFSVIPGFSA